MPELEENINQNYLFILDLNQFKIKLCKKNKDHNFKTCCFYHNEKDRRRDLNKFNYKDILCKESICIKGDNCEYSHNIIESLYHPNIFKKKFCFKYFSNKNCKFKKFCCFAHSEQELRIKLIHRLKQNYIFFLFFYKTEFCPLGKINHDLNMCVYSHNFQDYKRKYLFNKFPIICKNWNIKNNYNNYYEGCLNGIGCKFLHGWKEYSFHPIYFKKKLCKSNNKNCFNILICKNIHGNQKKYKNKKFLIPNDYKIY